MRPDEQEPPPALRGGKRAVLKFGGEIVADPPALRRVLAQVESQTRSGWRFAIVHGGGPQAGALQERLGLSPRKVGGRRVTDAETLRVMKQTLAGEVSLDVVSAALDVGLDAIGISGVSGGLVRARRRPPAPVAGGGPEPIDYGFVGEIVELRHSLIETLWAAALTPVINPLGLGPSDADAGTQQVFNINADTVASALAAALRVDHLFMVTAAGGVLADCSDPQSRIPRLSASEARQAVENGIISGGMIPKVIEAIAQLDRGIGAVHILGPDAGVLEAEARQPGLHGTVLVADSRVPAPRAQPPLRNPQSK